eukprot:1711898-Amphidinium_carterae.1
MTLGGLCEDGSWQFGEGHFPHISIAGKARASLGRVDVEHHSSSGLVTAVLRYLPIAHSIDVSITCAQLSAKPTNPSTIANIYKALLTS